MGGSTILANVLRKTFYVSSVPFIFLYLVVPLLFYCFPHFMQHIFFLNFVKVPFVDYRNLTAHGVKYLGRHFALRETGAKVTNNGEEPVLGVWHVIPKKLSDKLSAEIEAGQRAPLEDADFERLMAEESHGVVVYFHGNSFDRSNPHRCDLYNRLAAMDYHVLAIDYRGYGDSTGVPSEDGLIEDAHFIYNYAREKAPGKALYVWGHSMGTGVSSRFVAELSDKGIQPLGTVLESPFNNIHDVVKHHPFSKPFRWLGSFFDTLIIDRWVDSGLVMRSDVAIRRFKCPILILHAEDDHIIPIHLGKALYQAAKDADREVEFVTFDAVLNLRHKFIHKAPHLHEVLTKFFQNCEVRTRSKNRNHQEAIIIDH